MDWAYRGPDKRSPYESEDWAKQVPGKRETSIDWSGYNEREKRETKPGHIAAAVHDRGEVRPGGYSGSKREVDDTGNAKRGGVAMVYPSLLSVRRSR